MRVIQINGVCGSGSTGRIVRDLSLTMNEFNIQNHVFFGQGDSDYKHSTKIGSNLNIRSHQIASRITGKHGFYSKKATMHLIQEMKSNRPDIVHLHNLHGFYLNIELLFDYLRETSIKVVWTLHDCWSFTGHCAYFDFVGCDKWKTICVKCPNKKEYPISYFIDRSTKNFIDKRHLFNNRLDITLVTPSNWLENLLQESYLRNHKSVTINNGIDLDVFKQTQSNFRVENNLENRFLVLCIAAGLERRKGIEYMFEVAKRLDNSYQLIILGANKDQLKYLPEGIIGIERTNNPLELAKIYSSVDVYLNPTLEDNFPTTNLESLACGTPVITFHTGGSAESIDSLSGIAVEKGDLEGLIKAIDYVKTKGKGFFSDYCVKRARNLYDKNLNYMKYVELYYDICGKR